MASNWKVYVQVVTLSQRLRLQILNLVLLVLYYLTKSRYP